MGYPVLLILGALAPSNHQEPAAILILAALSFLPYPLLRRHPIPAFVLMLLGWSTVIPMRPHFAGPLGILGIVVVDCSVGRVAASARRAVSVAIAALATIVELLLTSFYVSGPGPVNLIAPIVLAIGVCWLIGDLWRVGRERAEDIRVRATAKAVTDERLRIARELHDLVAHSIGVIAIQAGVGARVIDTQPAEARNALATIEATSRETLAGLRRTLTALRRAEHESAPLEATTGLGDLDRLVATTAAAGVRVDVRWLGDRRPLPPEVDLAAYRIVQESLTNVVRHAGTDHCQVLVEYAPAEIRIEVTDDGRGGPVSGAGYGLAGMRERADLLDGELSFGPRAEGGFQVSVRLPLPEPLSPEPGR
ncbi:two-component sensor histidine kinase [Rugosimonospora africana]|uniref:histidine kinase n=1 Tax=Rugosimonospora africana TaxID=556532 RepID=A0A8J3VWB6_9ACTN|nr:two-component sensor histidine kinase [Rugosimonospora africana]